MKTILWFINHTINLIYPNVCGICGKIYKEGLCKKCESDLKDIAKIKVDFYKNKNFKKHIYLYKYEGIIKESLIKFKFNQKPYIHKAFVKFLIKNKKICRFFKSYDIIIAVPIHYKRKVERGYNQSELIAKEIAKNFSTIKYENKVLFKKINNVPQSSTQDRRSRELNVIGVYYTKNENKILNKKILLLDDIYTTGSTVNECSKILKDAGAKQIDILTIAKD